MGRRARAAGAWCGIAGPVAFTAAWVAGSLRQPGYSAGQVQISGLAAMDARDPQIMMAGFVGLGICSVAFGTALSRVAAAGTAGPWLITTAGAAVVAAGLFRRDHMLLTGPGFGGESWHNQVHDVVSGVAYGAMVAAPLVLARRLRGDPAWGRLSGPLLVIGLGSAVTLAVFASRAIEPWNPVIQRVAVTLPLGAEVLLAVRLLTLHPRSQPGLTGQADGGGLTEPGRRAG
jgi:Protein of unknown function (DUF998)